MPPSSRPRGPARYGSHQSQADAAAVAASQSELLARAAAAKTGLPATAKTITKHAARARGAASGSGAKRLFTFAQPGPTHGVSQPGRRGKQPTVGKAVFSAVRAKYQKGEKESQLTGAVYYRGKPRYGKNEKYKTVMQPHLLAESLRWNDQLKLYTGKVYNMTQLLKLKETHASLDEEEAKDLEAPSNQIDQDLFNFDECKEPMITSLPLTIDDVEYHAFGGMTYPFKDMLKDEGFNFKHLVDGQVAQVWAGDPDKKMTLMDAMIDYGFTLDEYDGVESADEEPDDDSFVDH